MTQIPFFAAQDVIDNVALNTALNLALNSGGGGSSLVEATNTPVPRLLASVAADTANVFQFGAPDPTGTADSTIAFLTAGAAAIALGYRYLFVPLGTYLVANMTTPPDIIFVGPGQLVGCPSRKFVIPEHTPGMRLGSDVTASHIPNFLAAVAVATAASPAVVVGVGDSTTRGGSPIVSSETMTGLVNRMLTREFPTGMDRILYRDYGIGGTLWPTCSAANWNATPDYAGGALTPSCEWWPNPTTTSWMSHVFALNPNLIMFNFGQNDGKNFDLTQMQIVLAQAATESARRLAAGGTAIDVVFFTNHPPSLQNPRSLGIVQQEGHDFPAGYTRTYARRYGFGIIDVNRWGHIARDGFDICDGMMELFPNTGSTNAPGTRVAPAVTSSVSGTLPFTFTQPVQDFSINLGIGSIAATLTPSAFWAAVGQLIIPLSSCPGNALILERDSASGNIAYTVNAATGVVSRARTVTSAAATPSSIGQLEITVKDGTLYVSTAAQPIANIFNGPVERHGGLFVPVISCSTGATGVAIALNGVSFSIPDLAMPTILDVEMYGVQSAGAVVSTTQFPFGGNTQNHLSSIGVRRTVGSAIAATRLST